MNDQIITLEVIRRSAEEAADNNRGSICNPYSDGSDASTVWLRIYYARILALSVECV